MATVGIKTKSETAGKTEPAVAADTVEEPRGLWDRYRALTHEVHRGFIAEWTVTIILLLFATTSLVQAFVIPSASMESSLLIGDHVLVDKLIFAPPGPISKPPAAVPRRAPRRHHRVPLPDGYQGRLREAGHRSPGRPYPAGQQAAHPQRARRQRAVRAAHLPVHRPVPRQLPRRAAGAGRDAAGDRHAARTTW